MSLKDKFNNFIDYFTEDGEEVEVREAKAAGAETQPVPQPTPQVTSPRPQISQREPVKPKPTPVAPVTTPVSTAAVKEPVSTTKIHLKILLACMNVNVNWLLIVRIQMKRLLMYAIPANTRKRLKLLIYYYLMRVF